MDAELRFSSPSNEAAPLPMPFVVNNKLVQFKASELKTLSTSLMTTLFEE